MLFRSAALAGLLLALAPSSSPRAQGLPPLVASETFGEPVLELGETTITWAEYTDWLTRIRGQLMASQYAGAFRLEQVAIERGIRVTDEEVDASLEEEIGERVTHTFGGNRDAWRRSIARLGRTEAGYLAQRRIEERTELISYRLAELNRIVPEEKIVREWERAYGKGGRRYQVRLIKLPFFAPFVPPELEGFERRKRIQAAREELLLEAEDLRAGLLAGDDFATVARKRSGDPESAGNGGVPVEGWDDTEWPTSTIDTLAALAPGDLSEPLFARGGYWIIEVLGVEETPLESVHAELEAQLFAAGPEQDEVTAAVDEAIADLDIQVQPVLWALPEEGQRVRALDEIVLFIDGLPVRRNELVRWLNHLQGELLATRFQEAWLIDRKAAAAGIQITPEALEERVDEDISSAIDEFFKGEREGWLERLASRGRDETMWRRELRLRTLVTLRVEELLRRERTISPAQVRGEYLERYGEEGRYYGVRVLQLDVKLPEAPASEEEDDTGRRGGARRETKPSEAGPRDEAADGEAPDDDGTAGEEGADAELLFEELLADAEARAAAARARFEAGEDFAALCRELGTQSDALDADGLVEGGFRPDQWPGFVAEVVVTLNPGDVTAPVRVGTSVYLFQLVEAYDVDFESVEGALLQELKQRRPSGIETAAYKNLTTRAVPLRVLPLLFE